jgi:hypothetical protein
VGGERGAEAAAPATLGRGRRYFASRAKAYYEQLTAERKLLTVPADTAEAAKLAPRYRAIATYS